MNSRESASTRKATGSGPFGVLPLEYLEPVSINTIIGQFGAWSLAHDELGDEIFIKFIFRHNSVFLGIAN